MIHRKAENLFNKGEIWSESTLGNKPVWQNQSVIVYKLNDEDLNPIAAILMIRSYHPI